MTVTAYPSDPPAPDVVEVSLFGPGVGECIVVHVGGARWLVVDSCNSETGRPVALEYLEAMGVPASAIVRVVATHWHDDHMQGLAEVLMAAEAATFHCSVALRREEFWSLIAASPPVRRTTSLGSGVNEMTAILEHLRDRKAQPGWAANNQTLLRDESTLTILTSLSPSPATLTRSFRGFAGLAPKLRSALRVVPDVAPNETSVVLHLQVGRAVVLLGADLEVTTSGDAGWHAIVASEERPTARASLYKVAHHGSQTADTAGIWESLLIDRPASMLTPFARSRLPRSEDLARLAAVSGRLFLSAPAKVRAIRRERAVERTIALVARKPPTPRRGKMGHIRLRLSPKTGAVISADPFGAAVELHVG